MMSERGYFERLSQRALVARQNAAAPGPRGGADDGEASWDKSRERLVAHRYRPENRIGRGRLGDIFEAIDEAGRDVGANRRVAIQLVDEKIAAKPRIADDLARAYALLQTSSHPNVVRILDFGIQPRTPYVVMDLLEGVSLRSVLAEAAPEPLGVDETWPVLLAVGEALQYLHAKGLTHGDLRPESVFVTFDYGIKLLDLAPHLPSRAPFYVEDAVDEATAKSDPRDDVYGLACLTYELLSGRHPFNANTPLEAHRARLEPRPLSGLSLRDWDAIARGLELERVRRTPTVKQYLQDLGLTGKERLRAVSEPVEPVAEIRMEQPRVAAVSPPPAQVQAPTPPPIERTPEVPLRWVLEEPPPAVRRKQPRFEVYRDEVDDEARARRSAFVRGALQATFSLAVVAGIVAFAVINYDGLRSAATDTMTAFDSAAGRVARAPEDTLDSAAGRTEPPQGAAIDPAAAPAAAPAAVSGPISRAGPEAAPANETGASVPTGPQASEARPSAAANAGGDPATAAPDAHRAEETQDRARESQAISVSAPAVSGSPVPSGPPFTFARPVVAVSERETAVAVVINRSGNTAAPATLSWWVSGDSATADDDYPELGQRVEHFKAGEDSVTVFIPLVRDSTPESTETFYVYLGSYDPARRHLNATSSMRVDIVDDD
jgi:hypothetical protein